MNNSKENILNRLYSLHRFGIKPGLERTTALLNLLDNPQNNFKSIHVAGTNGKGSVCSIVASILTEAGYKVGLYTSPHIIKFNERVRINGKKISDEDLIQISEDLLRLNRSLNCTFFEITTALAFKYFSENKVDFALIEAGLGGRFDSTNVISPILSIITKIDKDHQQYLGNTLKKIAFEKAGIIKHSIPALVAESRISLKRIFQNIADQNQSQLFFVKEVSKGRIAKIHDDLSMTASVVTRNNRYKDLNVPLSGYHQLLNLQTALSAMEILIPHSKIGVELIQKSLTNLTKNSGLSSRIELLRKNPPIIMDVSHNPAGLTALVDTILKSEYKSLRWNIIFGAMADKNIDKMLLPLKLIVNKLILCKPKIERAASISELEAIALNMKFNPIVKISDIETAIKFSMGLDEPLIVVGSFYLIEEAKLSLHSLQTYS
ncbi:MAG: bifunctional folylpolyglutamate synthase/dihydrofolate synthase [Candidatus Kapabacteria bacterium]|nr:bifunctional folylpolyglutamate synthase/dihydrofolate synthase [Candidatus Kapabacteria bacterium]